MIEIFIKNNKKDIVNEVNQWEKDHPEFEVTERQLFVVPQPQVGTDLISPHILHIFFVMVSYNEKK